MSLDGLSSSAGSSPKVNSFYLEDRLKSSGSPKVAHEAYVGTCKNCSYTFRIGAKNTTTDFCSKGTKIFLIK